MNNTFKSKREEITLKEKASIYITKELQDKIDYLHSQVGKKEWCGVLFYKIDKGDISSPKNLEITCHDMYLQDIGNETFTSADFTTESIIEMYDIVPDAENMIKGKIHTHHNMSCFHSGTDMADLHDNAPLHNAYLSLIVNFDGKYDCKIAYIANRKVDLNFKNSSNEVISESNESEILVMIDFDIYSVGEDPVVPTMFQERYEKVKKEKEEKTPIGFSRYYGGNSHNWDTNKNDWPDNSKSNENDWNHWNKEYNLKEDYIDIKLNDHRAIKGKQANLFESSKLRPLAEVKEDLSEKIFLILKMSLLDLDYVDQTVASKFNTNKDILEFLETYFKEIGNTKYDKFLLEVKDNALTVLKNIKPSIISKYCIDAFEGIDNMEYNEVSIDIKNIFICWDSIEEENKSEGFKINNKIGKDVKSSKRKGK